MAGGGGALNGFSGKPLGNEASQAVQVNEVGEFEAVTEGSTGSENRIPQAQRANLYAEINGASGTHFVQEDNTKSIPITRKISQSASFQFNDLRWRLGRSGRHGSCH